jgi:hypothetical protein
MIRWLSNVLRGRYRHWNDANHRNFAVIWQRAELLSQQNRSVFQEFLVSSLTLVDLLLGPDKGHDRLLHRDPLSISPEQFVRLHYIHLAGMAGLFAAVNPNLQESLKAGVQLLANNDKGAVSLFEEFACGLADLITAGPNLWCHITTSVGGEVSAAPTVDAYPYTVVFGAAAADAYRAARNKLTASSAETRG